MEQEDNAQQSGTESPGCGRSVDDLGEHVVGRAALAEAPVPRRAGEHLLDLERGLSDRGARRVASRLGRSRHGCKAMGGNAAGGPGRTRVRVLGAVALGLSLMVVSCSSDGGSGDSPTSQAGEGSDAAGAVRYPHELPPLHVTDGALADPSGRQVLLRGAAVNSLSDYYQSVPELPTVLDHDDRDWDLMADQGFSGTRLSVSWSKVEPERGEYADDYIDAIGRFIDEAAERGIYSVVDMHQMAWGKYIATPEDVTCPEGSEPNIGWEGAPEWATLYDDASTCRAPGVREASEAVQASFTSFYDNRDGIRDAYADMWGYVVRRLGDRAGLAGYDLMNEPFPAAADPDVETAYTDMVLDVIAQIRAAEADLDKPEGVIFLEPLVLAPLPGNRLQVERITDPNAVYAPHVYPFGGLSADVVFNAHAATAEELGLPLWIGEYYLGAADPQQLDETADLLDAMDDRLASWVWWTWQVACGDPHFNQDVTRSASEQMAQRSWHHLMTTDCPSGDHEPNAEALALVNRGYPRAAPGRLTSIESDPTAGTLTIAADDAPLESELVVWLPPATGAAPELSGTSGLADIDIDAVDGGAVLTATVTAQSYQLVVAA